MGRAPCCSKVGLKKGKWTAEEDKILSKYIQIHGEGSWRELPKNAGLLRCGKSCRLRWINYLRSDLKRGNISAEEEELIIRLHAMLGNRWSMIAGRIPGRTDNEIKNYWNTHLSRKLAQRGIDPVTHKPFCYSADMQKENITMEDVTSSIELCTVVNNKKAREMKKALLSTSKKNKVADSSHLKNKSVNMKHVNSRISNLSSSKSACSEIGDSSAEIMTSDPYHIKAEASSGSVESSEGKSKKENGEPKSLPQHEYPTSSLTVNSSCLWEESFCSNMLPSDMNFFGSFDTEELTMFENQLPDPSPASDADNGNMETGDLWSFLLTDVKESSCPSSLTWILPPPSHLQQKW